MENKFNYFFGSENEQYLFLQMPVMLIKDERFRGLSDSAKILYSLFLNRTSLSAKNGWLDDEGRVYIIYTVDEIMADLKCHEGKSNKSMNELKEIGLVKTVRRGLGKPNMIYVMNFATDLKYRPRKPEPEKETESPMEPLICDFHNSGIAKKTNHEMRKSQTINIYSNKNNLKEDLSIYPAQAGTEADHQRPAEPKPIDMIDKQQPKISETLEAGSEQNPIEPMAAPFACAGNQNSEIPKMTKETIADKICLAELISEYPDKEKKILELYDIICEVLTAGDAEKSVSPKASSPPPW